MKSVLNEIIITGFTEFKTKEFQATSQTGYPRYGVGVVVEDSITKFESSFDKQCKF